MKRPLSSFDWALVAGWLARQLSEMHGCWDDEGSHPCHADGGGEEEDCVDCWIRRAMKEVNGGCHD